MPKLQNDRISLATAKAKAERFMKLIMPFCERAEIAGSIRRQKADIGDIEIVAIPCEVQDSLFFDPLRNRHLILGTLINNLLPIIKAGDRYIQTEYEGTQIDLFLASPDTWGCVFTIRTGSAEFSHKLVTKKAYGGYCPDNLYFHEARIFGRDGEAYETPEEEDVFELLGLEFIEPSARSI